MIDSHKDSNRYVYCMCCIITTQCTLHLQFLEAQKNTFAFCDKSLSEIRKPDEDGNSSEKSGDQTVNLKYDD